MEENSGYLKKMMKRWLQSASELVYPSNIYCIHCGNLIDGTRPYALCDRCVRSLNWNNGETCERCGKILRRRDQEKISSRNGSEQGGNHRKLNSCGLKPENHELKPENDVALCFDCVTAQHWFTKGFSCVEYGRAERELVHGFKYKEKAYFGRKMADMMYDRIRFEHVHVDLLTPVPMYKKKQRQRGYNQAAILARHLSQKLKAPFDEVLVRTRSTEPMSGLGALQRRENVKEAFAVKLPKRDKIRSKRVMLIDDIYTTGSTADECSKQLLEAGAECVYVYAFASGANIDY